MAKTYIMQVTESGCKMIETDVPFEDIEEFIDERVSCEEDSEDELSEDDFVNQAERYMATEYPKIYDATIEAGTYDDDFFRGVENLCRILNVDTERYIDELCAAIINKDYQTAASMSLFARYCSC